MRRFLLYLFPVVFLAACRTTQPTPVSDDAPPLEETIDHASYEDFDPAPYEGPVGAAVQHDVPESLMNNRPEAGATRTAQGYRVQITQTQNKAAADALAAEATTWWNEQAAAPGTPRFFRGVPSAVYTAYRQPYYRVRVGNFATQAEAQRALSEISRRFPGASIVPDTVTLPR